jgi:hypothetical protein
MDFYRQPLSLPTSGLSYSSFPSTYSQPTYSSYAAPMQSYAPVQNYSQPVTTYAQPTYSQPTYTQPVTYAAPVQTVQTIQIPNQTVVRHFI